MRGSGFAVLWMGRTQLSPPSRKGFLRNGVGPSPTSTPLLADKIYPGARLRDVSGLVLTRAVPPV